MGSQIDWCLLDEFHAVDLRWIEKMSVADERLTDDRRDCVVSREKVSVMELTVGQRASRCLTVTAEHVKAFAQMTGDYNPLHLMRGFRLRPSLVGWWGRGG